MDKSHVEVLQRNHTFLKENLQVGPVLDALYQDRIFSQEDFDRCRREASHRKCEEFLEMLKKKGPEGYKTLCAALDKNQPFIKEQLDKTSTEIGSSDIIYVNKSKLEAQYKTRLAEKDREIAGNRSAIESLQEHIKQNEAALAELEETTKKEREDHITQIEKKNEEVAALKMELSKSDDDLQQSRAQCEKAEKGLQDEQEAYEALSGVPRSQTPDRVDVTEQAQQAGSTDKMCQFSTQSNCDASQLCLLPCFHSACKPCIDQQSSQSNQNCIQCPSCGHEFNMDHTAVDYVRRNEAAFAAVIHGEKKCNYIEMDHDAKAMLHCHDCVNLLCSDCHKVHDIPTQNRNHKITQAENIPLKQWLKEPNCRDHPDNKVQLYDHTCKQAVCIVCVLGAHKEHKSEDLEQAYRDAMVLLEEQVQKQQLKLEDVTDMMGNVKNHQNELGNTQRKLEQKVIEVFRNVAVKFLHRQRQLINEIKLSLQAPNEMVQEKLDTLHDVQTSIESTIDYTQRTLESTRREELITLTGVLQKKSDDNIKRQLPEDDTRDARILLSCHGQKALGELIDTFGGLASSLNLGNIPDSQPTLQGLLCREQETKALHEGWWHQLDRIIHRIPGTDTRIAGSQDLQPELQTSQDVYGAVLNFIIGAIIPSETTPLGITLKDHATMHIISKDSSVKFIICPNIQLDAARAKTDRCHVTTHGKLVNSRPATRHRGSGGLQKYMGTCSSTPIPIPPPPSNVTPAPHTSQYWETHSRVDVVGTGYGWPTLEMGVGEESQVDSNRYAYRQRRSWCVRVVSCGTHKRICTGVWQMRKGGKCCKNRMRATPGTQITLDFGVVLNVGRGRLAFIDLNREVVLGKADVEFREALLPMFGVGRHNRFKVNMKLISGEKIIMNDSKLSLIDKALA